MEKIISIIMPTFNCGRFIAESIETVISQTYSKWELIIVDDCSTDDTKKVVESFSTSDQRVKYHCLEVNSGAAMARNKGIELSIGSYIAFLDSDDLWSKDKLQKQIQFMEKNNYNFTCTKYQQIEEDGTPNNVSINVKKKVDYNGVLLSCPIGNSTVMYNVEKLGKFTIPNIRKRNDDALWLQILKKEKYAYGIDEVLMFYRLRKNSISSNKLDLVKYHWYLYREIEHLSVLRSSFHIICWGAIKVLKIK